MHKLSSFKNLLNKADTAINESEPAYQRFIMGGRLTKVSGVVASIAPMMGVAVLTAGLMPGAAMQLMSVAYEPVVQRSIVH